MNCDVDDGINNFFDTFKGCVRYRLQINIAKEHVKYSVIKCEEYSSF